MLCEEVGSATPGSNYNVHLPKGNYREGGTRLLSEMVTKRIRDKSEKMHPEISQLCIRKQKFIVRVVM